MTAYATPEAMQTGTLTIKQQSVKVQRLRGEDNRTVLAYCEKQIVTRSGISKEEAQDLINTVRYSIPMDSLSQYQFIFTTEEILSVK
jgi:hypothetical protein